MPNNKTKKVLAFCLIVLGTALPLLILGFALRAVIFSEYRATFENLILVAGLLMVFWWVAKFVRTRRAQIPRE